MRTDILPLSNPAGLCAGNAIYSGVAKRLRRGTLTPVFACSNRAAAAINRTEGEITMDALIPINYSGERPTISGRELHRELNIGTPYHMWFPRMCEYGFVENVDYVTVNKNVHRADGTIMPQVQHDHELTLNMAKEVSMLQRNEAGKRIRLYLIQVEESWNSPEQVMARALAIANRELAAFRATVCGLKEDNRRQEEKIGALEQTVETQRQTIEASQPKLDYLETILSSRDALRVTQIAADYNLTAVQLNKILHEAGLQYRCNGQWVLYRRHLGKGYIKSDTHCSKVSVHGSKVFVNVNTRWTQKGRLAIHEILKRRGIIPVMDRKLYVVS